MSDADPFATLGIAPTLDRQAIKLAYFTAVRQTPPHADPEGFRKLRSAYELLSDEIALRCAWLRAPIDIEARLGRWNARFASDIETISASQRTAAARQRALDLFLERCGRVRIGT